MSAYAVFTREETLDAAEMAAYNSLVRDTLAAFEYRLVTAYGRQDTLEGPETEGTIIVEFPSMQVARRWYDSPAYVKVREHRFKGARYRAIILEGV